MSNTAAVAPTNGATIHGFSDDPAEIIERIRSTSTPLEMIDARPGRAGAVYYYLRHQYVTDILNALTRYDWDMTVLREYLGDDDVAVLAQITLRVEYHGRTITISKQQWGSASIKKKDGKALSIGDDLKAATSDAKKKAAQEIGLGSDLSIPLKANTRKAFHATGTSVFKDKWDKARPLIVRAVTGGRKDQNGDPITSSNDLLDIEARLAIVAIDKEHKEHNLPLAKALADLIRPAIKTLYK